MHRSIITGQSLRTSIFYATGRTRLDSSYRSAHVRNRSVRHPVFLKATAAAPCAAWRQKKRHVPGRTCLKFYAEGTKGPERPPGGGLARNSAYFDDVVVVVVVVVDDEAAADSESPDIAMPLSIAAGDVVVSVEVSVDVVVSAGFEQAAAVRHRAAAARGRSLELILITGRIPSHKDVRNMAKVSL